MIIKKFEKWLGTCRKTTGKPYSTRTIEHYSQGLRTTSDDMLSRKIITKRLENMKLYELDIAICKIFNDDFFVAKDKTGKNMYSNAVKKFRAFVYLNSERGLTEEREETKIINDKSISATEKETIIKARIGQGTFKKNLLIKYDGKCIITGLTIKQTLIASHIKPWAVCDNKERIDVNNGLLLSATFDRLFDSGLITFSREGELVLSSLISDSDANILCVNQRNKYNIKYNDQMQKYIDYHNKFIFVGTK